MVAADPLSNEGVPVWEDGRWSALPQLVGEVACDVCVVGLGGSGLACVRELLAAGVQVAGVDGVGVAGGASGRNGGFLLAGIADFHHDAVRRYGRERARRWYRITVEEQARMARETPDAIRTAGGLRIAASPDEERDVRAQLRALDEDDFPVRWYEGDEGRGILIPTDGVFDPVRRARTMATRALALGAQLFERSPVVKIAANVVETMCGRIRARRVVVAVDGRLELLLPELNDRVRSARLQMLATTADSSRSFPYPVYTRDAWDYWQQLPSGAIALGGCRDVGGEAEWTCRAEVTEAVQQALERRLRQGLRSAAAITHRWAAIVAFTEDGLPIMEEVRPGVWAVGGYCGTGNVVGVACGRHAAQLALGKTTERLFA